MELNLVQTIAIYALPVVFAITLHEAAHGYVAMHLGDKTAWMLGRVSLNPVRHIDPVGTIGVPLLLLAVTQGAFLFGWAKPVPVNFEALRKPRRDMFWVSAAGPAANLAMALVWAAVLKTGDLSGAADGQFLLECAAAGIRINILFMALNLLPILPLDGGRMLVALLPRRAAAGYSRLEPWGLPILLGVISLSYFHINVLGVLLAPIMNVSMSIIGTLFQL
ncbi:MAG TPA: site-2 protease family protein [Burkholderiales bacterium]|nr:site-2 protease family protein [Burkholderiales bacterium]